MENSPNASFGQLEVSGLPERTTQKGPFFDPVEIHAISLPLGFMVQIPCGAIVKIGVCMQKWERKLVFSLWGVAALDTGFREGQTLYKPDQGQLGIQ